MKVFGILAFALIFWPVAVSYAAEPTQLSFEKASKIALVENPDLLALRSQQEGFSYRASQALAPNNPVISVNKNDAMEFSPFSSSAINVYSASITLGFPGKALSQRAQISHQGESVRELAYAKEIEILSNLSNTYASLGINAKLHQFLIEQREQSEKLLKLLEKKYASAQAAKTDLLNARVVVAGLQHDILVNENEKQQLITQFLNQIKKPGSKEFLPLVPEKIDVPELKETLEGLTATMVRNRHLLISTHKLLESAEAAYTQAALSPLPDFQLAAAMNVYNFAPSETIPGVPRDYSFSIGIAIPLFFPFNELNGIRAAAKDREVASAQYDSQYLNTLADLSSQYTNFTTNLSEIQVLKTLVIPAAKANWDLMVLTYSLGKADYFRLNDARGTWIQAEKDLLAKTLSAAQLFNQITQQVGCDLTKKEGPHACI